MLRKTIFLLFLMSFFTAVYAQDTKFDTTAEQIQNSMYSKTRSLPVTRGVSVCSSSSGKIEKIYTNTSQVGSRLKIYFDYNSAEIRETSTPIVTEAAKAVKEIYDKDFKNKKSPGCIYIKGFTDSTGTDEYNKVLSYKRADSVKNYIMKTSGIPKNGNIQLICYGYGESLPVVENEKNDQDRQLNRRVELSFSK